MYVVRTRSLGDNLSTRTLSAAKPGANPGAAAAPGEGAKDVDVLSKGAGASTDPRKSLSVASPAAKACLAAFETLKKPKLSARDRKLAELDKFYGARAHKALTSKGFKSALGLDKSSDPPF